MVEGTKLVDEALTLSGEHGPAVESIYVDVEAAPTPSLDRLVDLAGVHGVPVFWLEAGVLAAAADTVTPQPVLAVVSGAPVDVESWSSGEPHGLVLVLAGVADPGNAGTLVRSAEAVGATAVVACDDSVDLLAPKTVRSSAGSVLRVPLVAGGSPADDLRRLRSLGFRVAATAMGGVPYTTADLTGDLALVVGNEAHGLDPSVLDVADLTVTIPMAGRVESLNAGVAGSLVAFESARQRGGQTMSGPASPSRSLPA